jgi:hypothetical protein
MRRHRYSHVDGRRLLAVLGSAASSELQGHRRLLAQGPRCRSPSGSGNRRHYWSLALRIFFYRYLDLVRLDRITLSGLGFL